MGDTYKGYESFYNGGISSLDSDHGIAGDSSVYFTGKHSFATNLGFPGSIQTANQLKEAANAIKQGVKAFEVTMGVADTAEQIPKQHFAEMRALMKLSGVTPSVHAPFTIDPSGFEQQKGYNEANREEAERRLFGTLEKAKELGGDKGVKVVFHSSANLPGAEYRPGEDEDRFHVKRLPLVDRETGQIAAAPEEEKEFYFSSPEDFDKGGTLEKPLERVHAVNNSKWREKMTNLAQLQKMTNEVTGNINPIVMGELTKIKTEHGTWDPERISEKTNIPREEIERIGDRLQKADIFVENTQLQFQNAFHTAYKYGNENQKKALKKLAENFKKGMSSADNNLIVQKEIYRRQLDNAIVTLDQITTRTRDKESGEIISDIPNVFVPIEEFAREKASETFGNLAWKSFDKLANRDTKKTPIIAVENMYSGMAYSKAEDLAKLIDESRNKFVKNAVKNGMNENDARDASKKIIGVTWDVGHLNLLKKDGFTDKDIIQQTKKIAPYVKHVHLTDNFGYADSHLAPGMGNVPLKKILEELEKKGDLKAMSKIVEAPGFVQHFQKSPHGWTMAALGSPIYGAMMGPYWNQVVGSTGGGGYFGGPQAYLPDKHFSMYGSGFSSLPTELGGQMPGNTSRSTGTPMA